VNREKHANRFGMRDRTAVTENIADRTSDMNAFGLREKFMRQLQNVGIQTDLTLEVRNDSTRITFLYLAR
jgi:hypothetical protein